MQIKKSLMVAGAIATIGAASTAIGVSAATTGSNSSSGDGLVTKIAQKFNLNQDEVQKVFDEDRSTHEAEHKAKQEERLSQAVKDGKLTEDQKTKILAKAEEMKSQMEAHMDEMKDKTPEERKALMEKHRTDIEKWASDNGIPMEYLMFSHSKSGPSPKGSGDGEFHVRFEGSGDHKSGHRSAED